jgi:hypothetical protein
MSEELIPTQLCHFRQRLCSSFVTENSLHLFTALKIDPSCLLGSPSAWSQSPNYVSAKQKVMGLKVINDCAERVVKLATDFNNALTFDETQRQLVFQIVKYHHKHVTQPQKNSYKTDCF